MGNLELSLHEEASVNQEAFQRKGQARTEIDRETEWTRTWVTSEG